MLERFFNWFRRRAPEEQQLSALRASLDLTPAELPLSDVFPVFVPASFFEGDNWVGPFERLLLPALGLTWVVERPNQTMLYVSHRTAEHWEQSGTDWKQQAVVNLASRSEQTFSTSHFPREDGTSYALVFMHEDGYGPSRLLFFEELSEIFPAGYTVALPEMSCGIAVANDATPEERAKIEGVVQHCYSEGTRPLVPGMHSPELLRPALS